MSEFQKLVACELKYQSQVNDFNVATADNELLANMADIQLRC